MCEQRKLKSRIYKDLKGNRKENRQIWGAGKKKREEVWLLSMCFKWRCFKWFGFYCMCQFDRAHNDMVQMSMLIIRFETPSNRCVCLRWCDRASEQWLDRSLAHNTHACKHEHTRNQMEKICVVVYNKSNEISKKKEDPTNERKKEKKGLVKQSRAKQWQEMLKLI